VQCENCHGPGETHVKTPDATAPPLARISLADSATGCGNCHTGIFDKKAGATPVSMVENWEGEYCGRCHGRVSFPLANCYRCHSKSIKPALKK